MLNWQFEVLAALCEGHTALPNADNVFFFPLALLGRPDLLWFGDLP